MTYLKKKILVADDDPSILEVIELMLTEEGYDVVSIADGEAIYKLENNFPDLLLLDIWMSGIDGRDICSFVKKQENTKNIPVIMISANRDTETMAKEAGADDFIAKPFEMDELLRKVRRYLTQDKAV